MNFRRFSVASVLLVFLCAAVSFGIGAAKADQDEMRQKSNVGWTKRVMTEKELEKLYQRDVNLNPSASLRLLARLNARDFDYIAQDIREGKPIKVPNDFGAFKSWTPLQKYIADVADLPKFILIVKDIPFIGWYENGKLVGDSYVCIGKVEGTTRQGLFTVKEKDVSMSPEATRTPGAYLRPCRGH